MKKSFFVVDFFLMQIHYLFEFVNFDKNRKLYGKDNWTEERKKGRHRCTNFYLYKNQFADC